jgi:glutamate carboxypeptidase
MKSSPVTRGGSHVDSRSLVSFLEERLDAYLADLQTLVGIDSGSQEKSGVDAINGWLEDRLRKLGFSVARHPQAEAGDDLLAVRQGKGRGHILLLGHSDTVFPPGTALKRPMSIRGDNVLGPGTCDMKAGLLSGLYALAALGKIGFDEFESLAFLCVSDEESGERHSVPLIRSESRKADAVLTLEAARPNGDIVTARKAVRWYTVEAFGHAAHAGVEPEKGRSAILALAQHIVALDALNGLRPGLTINTGYVEGGSLPSITADYAKMRVDLRAATETDMQALEAAVHRQLAEASVPDVRIVVTLEEGSVCPAMERTSAVAELERLAQREAQALGFEVKGVSTGGASDASFAAAEGVPVLDGLGPIGGLDHSPDEYILLSSIVPRTALLARLIVAISYAEKERSDERTGSLKPSGE